MAQARAIYEHFQKVWEVVGGAENGGIIVREGVELSSAQVADRLATGAVLQEICLVGERLCFEKISGSGPETGWVSTMMKGKPLCVRRNADNGGQRVTTAADSARWWKPPPCTHRRPRVVCLHGTACSETIFKTQLAKLFPKAKDKVDLIFLEGRMKVNSGPAFETLQKYFPGHANLMYDNVSLDSKGWRVYEEPRQTLQWLQTQLKALEPVDGLLGFSQGANFALMLAAQAAAGAGIPIGFAILLSPSAPGFVAQLPEIFTEKLPMPMLVAYGEKEGYGAGMENAFNQELKNGKVLDTLGEEFPASHVVNLLCNVESILHKEDHVPLPRNAEQAEGIATRIISFVLENC